MSFERLNIELPDSFPINGRRYFKRSDIEHLKRCLIARAQGLPEPPYSPPNVEEFVNASTVARELGVAPRTMARRIKETIERRVAAPTSI
jgi:hypothetical protein